MSTAADEDQNVRLYPKSGAVRSTLAPVILVIAVLALGLFLYSLLGRYFFFAELIGNFRCQMLFMLVPVALLALATRQRWLAAGLSIAIAWCMIGVVWILLPASQPPPGTNRLKVMSFNVLAGNSEYESVNTLIRETDPDVITFLEYADNWHAALDGLSEQYPYYIRHPRWHGFGIAMYSKFPLSDSEMLQLTKDRTDIPFLVANVNFGGQTLRLAALHVLSPTNRYRMELRNRQFSEVADYLSRSEVPTVVMGDFNCTPWSPFLSDFLGQTGYRDSRQGFGYQASWHSRYWLLRIPIDHAFVSDEIHIHDRYVGRFAGSDHFPIVFELSTAN